MIFSFENRLAIVTGGSRGIGYAIAKNFLRAGMRVALVSSNAESLSEAASGLDAIGNVSYWPCDVMSFTDVQQTVRKIQIKHGSIDVLVNCAGILDSCTIHDLTEEVWDKVIDTNLKGSFLMIKHTLPHMKRERHPRIINISSNAGRMGGYANGVAYAASKGGVISLTYSLARRLAPNGITVNCVAPGTIESEMSKSWSDKTINELKMRFPIGRLGRPEDVAAAVAFFASIESSFITGAVLDVNGGLFMG